MYRLCRQKWTFQKKAKPLPAQLVQEVAKTDVGDKARLARASGIFQKKTEPVVAQLVPPVEKHKTRQAKAIASKTNRGTPIQVCTK